MRHNPLVLLFMCPYTDHGNLSLSPLSESVEIGLPDAHCACLHMLRGFRTLLKVVQPGGVKTHCARLPEERGIRAMQLSTAVSPPGALNEGGIDLRHTA